MLEAKWDAGHRSRRARRDRRRVRRIDLLGVDEVPEGTMKMAWVDGTDQVLVVNPTVTRTPSRASAATSTSSSTRASSPAGTLTCCPASVALRSLRTGEPLDPPAELPLRSTRSSSRTAGSSSRSPTARWRSTNDEACAGHRCGGEHRLCRDARSGRRVRATGIDVAEAPGVAKVDIAEYDALLPHLEGVDSVVHLGADPARRRRGSRSFTTTSSGRATCTRPPSSRGSAASSSRAPTSRRSAGSPRSPGLRCSRGLRRRPIFGRSTHDSFRPAGITAPARRGTRSTAGSTRTTMGCR